MTDYPVRVEVTSPPHFERMQLLLRIAMVVAAGWLGITFGWFVFLLYGVLPVVAASGASLGGDRYTRDLAPQVARAVRWLVQLSAFMMLLVDRFPTGDDGPVRVDIRITARPTIGSALARLVTSLPSGIVLSVLWCISDLMWLAAALIVVFDGPIPASILGFQRGVLRWQARLLAYHASLVDEYPPFTFDSGPGHGDLAASSAP